MACTRRLFGLLYIVRKRLIDVQSVVFNWLTLGDNIPSDIYATDIRLAIIVTAIYVSLVTQFRQVGNQEAATDITSGMNFKINSEFTNNSISGGISDRVLWNCREGSSTDVYHKTLYAGLLLSYFLTIAIYFVASVMITLFVANAAWTLTYNQQKGHHLELMANGFKIINQLSRDFKHKRDRAIGNKQSFDDFKAETKELATEWNENWKNLVGGCKGKKFLYNWLAILYIIPRYESLIMLAIVTFSVTSYDIYPIGCLSHIDVFYDEAEMSVTLYVSESVIIYQRASIVLIGLLFFHWGVVKIVQYLLLPRKWGLLINKCFSLNLQGIKLHFINHLLMNCHCGCKETKCCSVNCSLPCEANDIYDPDNQFSSL